MPLLICGIKKIQLNFPETLEVKYIYFLPNKRFLRVVAIVDEGGGMWVFLYTHTSHANWHSVRGHNLEMMRNIYRERLGPNSFWISGIPERRNLNAQRSLCLKRLDPARNILESVCSYDFDKWIKEQEVYLELQLST